MEKEKSRWDFFFNWKWWLEVFLLLLVGILIGAKFNLSYLSDSIVNQCNDYVIEHCDFNDIDIKDPYGIKNIYAEDYEGDKHFHINITPSSES